MSRSILIVDDDPLIRRLIATTLEDVSDMVTAEAGDGEEALRVAAEIRPVIVFLDIDMPRLDGFETCRRLRAREHGDSATIVMLTAATDDDAPQRAQAAGADMFLTKPFSPLELLRLVDRIATA